MKYEANAGPSQGDHSTDRAINALPLPQYPIAPPAVAGSVDTPEFQQFLEFWRKELYGTRSFENAWAELVSHIDAWGAQQREAGKREVIADAVSKQGEILSRMQTAEESAEKAEAELKQVNEWRAAALASNQQMQELMAAKLATAEARANKLEAKLSKAQKDSWDAGRKDGLVSGRHVGYQEGFEAGKEAFIGYGGS